MNCTAETNIEGLQYNIINLPVPDQCISRLLEEMVFFYVAHYGLHYRIVVKLAYQLAKLVKMAE